MSTVREKILQKLNPKLLNMTPKLSGDTGSFIDLDCDDSLEKGAKNLMRKFFRNQDLCEKNKRNSSSQLTELTVSSAKYNDKNEICEIISETVILPFVKNELDEPERPGRRLQRLKMELQEKMSAKWEKEYKKRVNENKFYSGQKHKKKCSDDEDDEEEEEEKENCDGFNIEKSDAEDIESKDINEEVVDDDDDDGELGDDEEDLGSDGGSDCGDEANTNNICEDELENDDSLESERVSVSGDENTKNMDQLEKDDDYDDGDGCSLVPAYQPGGGMLYGGSELTQSEEGLPKSLLSPSLSFSMTQLSGSKQTLESVGEETPKKSGDVGNFCNTFDEKMKLFSQKPNDSFDLNEAFEFCSGRFPDAENNSESQFESQNQVEESSDVKSDCSELIEENQSDNNEMGTSKTRRNIITFEDSDAEQDQQVEDNKLSDNDDEVQEATSKLLSDDEEEENEETNLKKKKKRKHLQFSDDEDREEEEEDGKSENSAASDDDNGCEIPDDQRSVHYDSEENEIMNPREFFEKEAELSGSEWSGDEDERGLDEFDVEEGDDDKLDNDQVRSQLEKIHIRRVLDDDAREVRLIQEILFEDGDLHSDGKRRDRKFKWKNLGAFDDQENRGELVENGGNSSEEDDAEEELRKIRHERELFLMTKKKNGDLSSDEEIVEDFHSIKVASVKTSIKVLTNENAIESSKSTTDYTRITKSTSFSNSRGSFLTRNEEFLSRLAKATSGITENVLGPKNSKNFVFTTKSPEKKNQERSAVCKRQSEDLEKCGREEKKIKLLRPEIVTGPSILDLLV